MSNDINIRNKRASFDYEFIEEYNAGMILTGTEIKSIRAGKASLVDSYCYFDRGELWVKGIHIAEYRLGTYYNHDENGNGNFCSPGKNSVNWNVKSRKAVLRSFRSNCS